MRAFIVLTAVSLALVGCRPITDVGDKIIGLTNPVLVGGIVLGSAPPADPRLRLALQEAGFTGFTEARLVVADALEFQDIDQALIPTAEVTLTAEGEAPVAFLPDDAGWFAPERGQFLSYSPGRTLRVEAILPDRVNPGTIEVPLPDVATIDVAAVRPAGRDLPVDLSGQAFDYAFAAVYDLDGNEVFSNAPSTNDDILDFVLPAEEPVEEVTVPGDVFAAEDIYIVGIAGLKRAPPENIEGLNEALTAVLAGRLSLFPVIVGSPLVANALVLDIPPLDPAARAFVGDALPAGLTVELSASDLLLAGEPIEGADVTANGAPMEDVGAGRYRIEGLAHTGEADLRVDAPGIDTIGTFDLDVPAATEPDFPVGYPAATDMYVSTPGGPWQAMLITVYDANGEVWTNVPSTSAEWKLVVSRSSNMFRARIPAAAFPTPGTYAIAIAGLQSLDDVSTNVNPRFSQVMAGTLGVHTVTVF